MAKQTQPEFKPIAKKVFDDFFADIDGHKETKDAVSMKIAQAYKEHKSTFGLHPEAAKLVYKLRGKSPEERADFLRAFDEYRETVGLDDQLDLFDEGASGMKSNATTEAAGVH